VGKGLLRVSFPFFALTLFTEPFLFSILQLLHQSMARTKTTANPPPPKINYRALYSWTSDELLEESSTLTSMKDLRDHIEGSGVYQHRAFARRHDEDITVLPCIPGEPVCGDERANNGVPFFFFYQVVFKRIGMRLPFSRFERELLTEINVAPAQLHPNSWAFVKAFDILCGYFGHTPSVDIFLHFFELKKQGKSLWVSFSSISGRVLLTLFQQSFKGWRGKFFRVCCSDYDHTVLDGFPLYWVKKVKLTKPKSLDELPSADREACQILASVGAFNTSTLISREYDVEALANYKSMETISSNHLFSTSVCFHLVHDLSALLV